jgi:argininosuccinate lyase
MLKGLPSSYNKDMQDDKRALFGGVDVMLAVLPAVAGTIASLTMDAGAMRRAVTSSMMATDLADYLVRRGVAFRDAHRAVGLLVREAEEARCEMTELPLESFTRAHALFGREARDAMTPEHSIAQREIAGGTGLQSVRKQIELARQLLQTARPDLQR